MNISLLLLWPFDCKTSTLRSSCCLLLRTIWQPNLAAATRLWEQPLTASSKAAHYALHMPVPMAIVMMRLRRSGSLVRDSGSVELCVLLWSRNQYWKLPPTNEGIFSGIETHLGVLDVVHPENTQPFDWLLRLTADLRPPSQHLGFARETLALALAHPGRSSLRALSHQYPCRLHACAGPRSINHH